MIKQSLAETYPDIAAQWNYEKNKGLKNKFGKDISTPDNISPWSNIKVWWLYPYDVPDDYPIEHLRGKHFDFEWMAPANDRVSGKSSCPFLNNGGGTRAIYPGFNDLATTHPKIAAKWHPTKNGNLKPSDVSAYSCTMIWWMYPYDDPVTGKHFDFEWQSSVKDCANLENDCPYLGKNNPQLWPGFNDLATVRPDIAKDWHPTKNGDLKPTDVAPSSGQKVWWLYPYDVPDDYPVEHLRGKHFDFEWEASVNNRSLKNVGCPYIDTGGGVRTVYAGYNDLTTTHPELAVQWHPTKNGDLTPADVPFGSSKKVWWLYPYDVPADYPIEHLRGKHFDFEWEAPVSNRLRNPDSKNQGCPYLSGKAVWPGFNDLETLYPEIAKQLHPAKNKDIKASKITSKSNLKVWWKCDRGHEWQTTIARRTYYDSDCPFCKNTANQIFTPQHMPTLKAQIHFISEDYYEVVKDGHSTIMTYEQIQELKTKSQEKTSQICS